MTSELVPARHSLARYSEANRSWSDANGGMKTACSVPHRPSALP